MKQLLEIKPLHGFGEIKFGVSQDDVVKLMGDPDEKEVIDVEGEIHEVEVWSYFEPAHSFYFERDLDNLCTNFETENESSVLFGEKIFALSREGVIALMEKNGFDDYEIEDEPDMDETIVFFHQAHMQFVFDGDRLGLVSWAVAMNDQDEILWP